MNGIGHRDHHLRRLSSYLGLRQAGDLPEASFTFDIVHTNVCVSAMQIAAVVLPMPGPAHDDCLWHLQDGALVGNPSILKVIPK